MRVVRSSPKARRKPSLRPPARTPASSSRSSSRSSTASADAARPRPDRGPDEVVASPPPGSRLAGPGRPQVAISSLRDKYCIVGVGETEYSRHSGRTTRAMAVEAVRKAILDAGLRAADVDGMMSYQNGDSTPANWVAPDLGIRLNFYMDVLGGGSSTEALIGLAMGAIEAGMCRTVAIFRSMNGYTEFRIGGARGPGPPPLPGGRLPPGPLGQRGPRQHLRV